MSQPNFDQSVSSPATNKSALVTVRKAQPNKDGTLKLSFWTDEGALLMNLLVLTNIEETLDPKDLTYLLVDELRKITHNDGQLISSKRQICGLTGIKRNKRI